jgi:UDP-galactopyranose mutase
MKYDYLIVGSGLFGAVFAHEMTKSGKKCLVIEKRKHIGGNCYSEKKDNINVHIYGSHIFHTNDLTIWNWINQFTEFNNYQHRPKVSYLDKIYSFPINLLTLCQVWGVTSPEMAKEKLNSVVSKNLQDENFETFALSQIGKEIYEIFIKGYTKKQWGRDPKDLPSAILKRIPIRTNFNDNYFSDKYQGIPVDGYTKIFEKIFDGIDVMTDVDFFDNKDYYYSIADKIVFTGKIDEFFDYKYGKLEYRSLDFVHEKVDLEDFQGCAVMNYTHEEVPYTRITEHKHFENSKSDVTWITKEYSKTYTENDIPYYPINDKKNNEVYQKYAKLAETLPNVIFGGRLAEYKYYDMHQIIGSALKKVKVELSNKK